METRMFKNTKEIGKKLILVCRFGNGVKKKLVKNWYGVIGLEKTGDHMASYLRTPEKTAPAWTPWL